jgi:polyhydroxyalkanoate synthase
MWDKMFGLMNSTVAAIGQMQQANMTAALRGMELTTNAYARLWGLPTKDVVPSDSRFKDEAWCENPVTDMMRQAYLITAQWMEDMADSMESIDPTIHHRTKFWSKQIADALSPSNFALSNPEVMQEIIRTGGTNLVQGMQNLLEDMQRRRISHVATDAFEIGKDLAITPGKVIYRNPLIELIQYVPTTKKVHEIPLLMIAPWINKFYVMDMRPENSMFKYLVDSGFTVFAISWKNPDETILDLEWDDYMDKGPLDALRVVKEITGAEKVNTVGYCLGGIILQTVLAYLAATGAESINSASFFTTHQDFTDAGDVTVFISKPEVKMLEWMIEVSGGYLDGTNLAATFNMLRANDLLWNYVIQNYLLGRTPPAFDLLYWNSDNTRVPGKVHSFLVREFFLENKLKESHGIEVKGVGVDLSKIMTPCYTVAATGDHIVPWKGAYQMRQLMGGPVRFVLTSGGHIAGVINHPAKQRREYWLNENETADPDVWLASAAEYKGSWWEDWCQWLAERSGREVAPPSMGNDEFTEIMDAPGTYVLEK